MQLFVRGQRTVALDTADAATVADVKATYAARALQPGAADMLIMLHNGRQLRDAQSLACAGVRAGATLSVTSRLRGGGGDGGSTGAESRSCYLEMYAEKKPDKVNPAEEMLARATRCRLSGDRLSPPCVADELGCLYNKEALVHALLNKTLPPALSYIASLKSVTTLKLEPVARSSSHTGAGLGPGSSSGNGAGSGGGGGRGGAEVALFQCPVTGLGMNGRVPFVVHRPSGIVLSERALREVPAAAQEVLGAASWTAADLIPVNASGEELAKRREALAAEMAADRARKAAKKAAKAAGKAANGHSGKADAAAEGGADGAGEGAAAIGGKADAAAAAAVGSKRGLPPAAPAPALADGSAPAAAAAAAVAKKMKLPPGATPSVYASIFSSGKEASRETFLCRSATGRYTAGG